MSDRRPRARRDSGPLGVVGIGSLFAVGGAVAGAAVAVLARAMPEHEAALAKIKA